MVSCDLHIMKRSLPTVHKARSKTGYHKHLRKDGKRTANKGTRQALKGVGREAIKPEELCLCDRCRTSPAESVPHVCPYAEDIHGCTEATCTCCADCTHECAMDI